MLDSSCCSPAPAPSARIVLTLVGHRYGEPAAAAVAAAPPLPGPQLAPALLLHYQGTYSDASGVYERLGPATPLEPGQVTAVQMVRAELQLRGMVMAAKHVRLPRSRS